MDKVKIVQAHPEHIDKVVDLYGGYREFYGQKRDSEQEKAFEKSFIEQRMKKNESVIFLAIDEDGLGMGFTQLYPLFSSVTMRRVWLLNDLYVDMTRRSYTKRTDGKEMTKRICTSRNAINIY
jgi:hypothetical protein